MNKTQRRVGLASLGVAVLASMVMLQPTAAAAGTHAHKASGGATTIAVVAEGLDVPRGVTYDPVFRRVLVAEAGEAAGNTGPCAPGADGVVYCVGTTGAIFQYTEYSTPRRIVTGLSSIKSGGAVLGVHDLDLFLGQLNLVFGLSGDETFRDALGPAGEMLAHTATVDWFGNVHLKGDLVAFEEANNPEPFVVDSDPYGMVRDFGGTVVADAAGNDVVRVKHNGTVELMTVIPNRGSLESVPTAVVRGPDGAYYIGELSGFPFPVGQARVMRLAPGASEATVFATGLTNIIDITFDERGRLYVLEIAKNGLLSGDPTGRLVRVNSDGSQTDIATTGLENPGGVASAGHGVFFVTNRTASFGNVGQLLKISTHG